MSAAASSLKDRLRSDLTTAIKERDKVRSGTIRMVLSAISEAEVAGKSAVELTDAQVLDVVIREAKKRREAEEAFAAAGRPELAERERSEATVLADYLPSQLSADEVAGIVAEAIVSTGAGELGLRGIGKVMGAVTPRTKGRADGGAVAAEVRRQLSGGG
ncbi:MAG TPA: GatB/YqeY domain-containing protein [Propionibacteriaceae bacterium]|nr:GatB/YqeY domain-containing protein [Propionibacteriaceae bacterium]